MDISTYASLKQTCKEAEPTLSVEAQQMEVEGEERRRVSKEEQARLSLMIPPRRVLLSRIPPSPDVVKQVESCVDVQSAFGSHSLRMSARKRESANGVGGR